MRAFNAEQAKREVTRSRRGPLGSVGFKPFSSRTCNYLLGVQEKSLLGILSVYGAK